MKKAGLADAERLQPFILPSRDAKRWFAKRKAAVVITVCNGAISRGKACERYRLSPEELASWKTAGEQYGTAGLRASHRYVSRRAAFRLS